MNAELLGIITVGIVLLGVGVAFVAQSDEVQTIFQIDGNTSIGQYTPSPGTDFQQYCEIIPAVCR
jgi:hypothetical protein